MKAGRVALSAAALHSSQALQRWRSVDAALSSSQGGSHGTCGEPCAQVYALSATVRRYASQTTWRLQSASRFARTSSNRLQRGDGTGSGAGTGGTGASDMVMDSQSIKTIHPIRTVAALQTVLRDIRTFFNTRSSSVLDKAQDVDNRRRHLLRQLLCFSLSSLPPEEQRNFTVATMLQVVQALQHFHTDVAWEETTLVVEMTERLAHEVRLHLARSSGSSTAVGQGTDATATDAPGSLTATHLSQCMECAYGLALFQPGALGELVQLLLNVVPVPEVAPRSVTPMDFSAEDLGDKALDNLLVCGLSYLAGATQTYAAAVSAQSRPAVDPFTLTVVDALGRRLTERLAKDDSSVAAYVDEEMLIRVLTLLATCTGGSETSSPGIAARRTAGGDAGALRGEAVDARERLARHFRTVEWRRFVELALGRLTSGNSVSGQALDRTVSLAASTARLSMVFPPSAGADAAARNELDVLCEGLFTALVAQVPNCSAADLAGLVVMVRGCYCRATDDETSSTTNRVRVRESKAFMDLSQAVERRLGTAFPANGDDTTNDMLGLSSSITDLANLAAAYTLDLVPFATAAEAAALPLLLSTAELPAPLVAVIEGRISAAVAPSSDPNALAEFSPRAVAILVELGLHQKVGKALRSASWKLLSAYYEHIKMEFNHNKKIFPSDVSCIFCTAIADPTAAAAAGDAAVSQEERDAAADMMKGLSFAVQANLRNWAVPEVLVFLHSLSELSARMFQDGQHDSMQGRSQAAEHLRAAHCAINGIIREALELLAPFVKKQHHPSSSGANKEGRAQSGSGAGSDAGEDIGGSSDAPSAQEVDTSSHGVPPHPKSTTTAANAHGPRLSPTQVRMLLCCMSFCGVQHEGIVESASERFASLFRDAAAALEGGCVTARNATNGSHAAGGVVLEPITARGGSGASLSPMSWEETDAHFAAAPPNLAVIADVLASLSSLAVRGNRAFINAAPLVIAGATAASESFSSSPEPLRAFSSVSPDTLTRLFAAYASMLVFNFSLYAALTDAVKVMETKAPCRLFTLGQLCVVQKALMKMNASDKELSELFMEYVETELTLRGRCGTDTSASPSSALTSPIGDAYEEEAVMLLSTLSRVSYALREEERRLYGFAAACLVDGGGLAEQTPGSSSALTDVNTFEHFHYRVSDEPLQCRARKVCAQLADRVLAEMEGTRRDTRSGGEVTVIRAEVVAEVLISLARVFLFDHPLFAYMRRESLSAVLRPASSLCLSQMTRAVALAAVVERQAALDDDGAASPVATAATSGFYDEYFALASSEALRMVNECTISAVQLSHVLYSFTIAGQRDDKLFITVLPKMRLLTLYGTFEEISETFYSYAKNNLWHQKLFARLADRVIEIIKRDNILHRSELILVLESLAAVRYNYEKLMSLVAVRILTVLHLCTFQEVLRLVRCFSSLGIRASPPSSSPQGDTGAATGADATSSFSSPSMLSQSSTVYDAFYLCCGDRVVDLLRSEKQHGRAHFIKFNAQYEKEVASLLADLSQAGFVHEQLIKEVKEVFPKMNIQ